MTARDPDLRPPRLDAVAALAVFVVAFGVLLAVSHATGPAFEELGRLANVEALEPTVLEIAARGPVALTNPDSRAAFSECSADHTPTLLALAGAWSVRSVARLGMMDPLTSARLPWLAICATMPALLFVWVHLARQKSVALAAAGVLLAMPPFLHGAAVTRPALVTAASWMAIATASAAARRSNGRRRTLCLLGVGFTAAIAGALGSGALSALALVTLHDWLSNPRRTVRLARAGAVALPSAVLVGALAAPIGWLGLAPEHWGAPTIELIRAGLAPLAPSIAPTVFAGQTARDLPVPGGYAGVWLACATPLAIGLAALIGLGLGVHRGLARHFASGRRRPPRDPVALGTWVFLGIAASVVGPLLAIRPLVVFPPRIETALPFVAIAAALGASFVGERILGPRGHAVAWAVAGVVGVFALRDPGTLSAAYDGVVGPRTIQRLRLLPVGDGSELGRLAHASGELSVRSSEVPEGYWLALARAGIPTSIVADSSAPYALTRGADPRPAIARVERSGAVLWSIVPAR